MYLVLGASLTIMLARVFVPRVVPAEASGAIAAEGATVTVMDGPYDRAVELAALCGRERVDHALTLAAEAERFGENDLATILEHIDRPRLSLVQADESFSAQPGTGAWKEFGK